MGSTSKAVDEPATLSGREGDEPDPVRAGVEPRGLEVDPIISADRISSMTDSTGLGWLSEVAAPRHRQSFGYGNFGNRNNRSWSRDVLVGSHIVADRCCRIVF